MSSDDDSKVTETFRNAYATELNVSPIGKVNQNINISFKVPYHSGCEEYYHTNTEVKEGVFYIFPVVKNNGKKCDGNTIVATQNIGWTQNKKGVYIIKIPSGFDEPGEVKYLTKEIELTE
ncbi:hypothetical protein EDM00_04575 [Ornithobacterium rhinotracheale]|nr:hypothetical protein [Ornithobacterium rhinotracheale]MRJ08446.1 hypothetical protein [Ornithobacterium rhinotracheale]MRJ09984.1 hypothetical protein [Ornithobacterium rhinotracheale]